MKPEKELLNLARELIERKAKPFDPKAFKNQYDIALRELIAAKMENRKPQEIDEPELGAKVINLMDALKKSVGRARPRARRASAARSPRHPPRSRRRLRRRRSRARTARGKGRPDLRVVRCAAQAAETRRRGPASAAHHFVLRRARDDSRLPDAAKTYWVYILASRRSEALSIVGVTSDMAGRVQLHRMGKGSVHVARYRIFTLVYAESYADIGEAISREKQLKKWRRQWKIALIEGANPACGRTSTITRLSESVVP